MERADREANLPLPSEDTGDLVDTPTTGETDDPIVATEEGVPYVPPNERVLTDAREEHGGADVAGTAPTADEELGRVPSVQPPSGERPADDELRARVVEKLRASNIVAGDRLQVDAAGGTVLLKGRVDSITTLDEIIGLVGEVEGVQEVTDQVEVEGA